MTTSAQIPNKIDTATPGEKIDKKYKIISTIENDAPFANISWYTISFLTPQKIDKINFLDILGFKIHNGYVSEQAAKDDSKEIKKKNNQHDVFVAEMGRVYEWDDVTKADEIEYDDEKLNDLEKTRRENIDKIKLMSEQFTNEYKTLHAKVDNRKEQRLARMQAKLYDKGLITKKEYDLLQEDNNKTVKNIKQEAAKREEIDREIETCFATDYLDENDPVGLKFICLSIYLPSKIGGLKNVLFKIRGLFDNEKDLKKRIRKLESVYPNDPIYRGDVGKWTPFTMTHEMDFDLILKQLNYAMKCHIENLSVETQEFEERKKKLKEKTNQESKLVKLENRKAKRREARQAAKESAKTGDKVTNIAASTVSQPVPEPVAILPTDNPVDAKNIQDIFNFLDEPELRNKFPNNPGTDRVRLDV